MTEQEIHDQLRAILVEEFEIAPDDIKDDARLYDDLGIDSIDAVDLLVHLKDQTGLRVPPEDFKTVRTYGDVMTVLKTLVS